MCLRTTKQTLVARAHLRSSVPDGASRTIARTSAAMSAPAERKRMRFAGRTVEANRNYGCMDGGRPSRAGTPTLRSARCAQRLGPRVAQVAARCPGLRGLCGVLTGDNGTRLPMWLQSVAGMPALLALAVAAIGVLLVALVAWPLGAPADPTTGARRLRAGVILTGVAVGLTAFSASSNWWPQSSAERPVQVSTSSGTA